MFSYGLPHMDTPVVAEQQKLIFISYVKTVEAILEDLLIVMTNRDGWWESVKEIYAVGMT